MRMLPVLLLLAPLLVQCKKDDLVSDPNARRPLEGIDPSGGKDGSPSGLEAPDGGQDLKEQALDTVLSISLSDAEPAAAKDVAKTPQPAAPEDVVAAADEATAAEDAAPAAEADVQPAVPLPKATDPAGPQQVFDRFQALVKEAEIAKGTQLLEEWLKVAPKDQVNRTNLARTYIQLGQLESAVPHLAQLTSDKPDDSELWAHYARVLTKLGRHSQAVDAFQKSWGLKSDDVDVGLDYARTLSKVGRYGEAVAVLESAQRLGLKKEEVLAELAATLAVSGQYPKALEIYQRLQEMKPSLETALTLAQLAHKFQKCDDVVATLTPYEAKFTNEIPYLLLADCFKQREEWQAVEKWLSQAVGKTPDCYDCRVLLGDALSQRSLYAQAEPHYRKAVTLKPADHRAYLQLGQVLALQGKHKEAAVAMGQANERQPNDAAVLEPYCIELGASGQRDAAWRVWGQLNDVNPEAAKRIQSSLPK